MSKYIECYCGGVVGCPSCDGTGWYISSKNHKDKRTNGLMAILAASVIIGMLILLHKIYG